jgi:hypothetical protein
VFLKKERANGGFHVALRLHDRRSIAASLGVVPRDGPRHRGVPMIPCVLPIIVFQLAQRQGGNGQRNQEVFGNRRKPVVVVAIRVAGSLLTITGSGAPTRLRV